MINTEKLVLNLLLSIVIHQYYSDEYILLIVIIQEYHSAKLISISNVAERSKAVVIYSNNFKTSWVRDQYTDFFYYYFIQIGTDCTKIQT